MKTTTQEIGTRIRKVRVAKNIRQSDLDIEAKLPRGTISKIELGYREATVVELVQIAHVLGTNIDSLISEKNMFVSDEEVKVIEALRELDFDEYQRVIRIVEGALYFTAKYDEAEKKEFKLSLVQSLARMGTNDMRPRSQLLEKKRANNPEVSYESRNIRQ
jgi:transcriptional regulator with XRE-family HTH domain